MEPQQKQNTTSTTSPISQPPTIADTLPIEKQAEIWDALVLTQKSPQIALATDAVAKGIINPWKVAEWRAQQAFVTTDPDTLRVKEQAVKLSQRGEPVLVTGESGTGKEMLASILHGARRGQLVAVNVCSIVDTLFESELFGHVRGAFTGADRDRDGLIKQADNGTLFLDEIGDMPLALQAKILRTINNRCYRKVGGNKDEPLQCRIVAATHRSIREMVKLEVAAPFRLDLYQRLSVFELHLKPLRDRWDDAKALVKSDVKARLDFLMGGKNDKCFSGNIRQLLNLALRIEVLGPESVGGGDIL